MTTLGDTQVEILNVLAQQPWRNRPETIASAAYDARRDPNYALPTTERENTQKALRRLENRGLALEDEDGRWTITDAGREELNTALFNRGEVGG
jgi:hypothetical protein